MKVIIQRVQKAWIKSFDKDKLLDVASIQKGVVVYVGFCKDDTEQNIAKFARKLFDLPIFENHEGKLKLSLADIDGEAIIVPNFTLCGSNKKWRAIDYSKWASFVEGKKLREILRTYFEGSDKVQFWVFGSYMQIWSLADGPVNLDIDF